MQSTFLSDVSAGEPDGSLVRIGLIVGAAVVASTLLIVLLFGSPALAIGFALAAAAVATFVVLSRRGIAPASAAAPAIDWAMTRAAIESDTTAIAATDREGRLVCANDLFGAWFEGFPSPPNLPVGDAAMGKLADAARAAWRDGSARIERIAHDSAQLAVDVVRAGERANHLVWRFRPIASR